MALGRAVLRALGRRLPRVDGTLSVAGLSGPVTIRRDRFGIPHVRAGDDAHTSARPAIRRIRASCIP